MPLLLPLQKLAMVLCLWLGFVLVIACQEVDAFLFSTAALATGNRQQQDERKAMSPSRLFATRKNDSDCREDIEEVRRQLEELMSGSSNDKDNNSSNDENSTQIAIRDLIQQMSNRTSQQNEETDWGPLLPSPPPLTTAEKERKLAEMKYLEQLASTDFAVKELEDLWRTEKGTVAGDLLSLAEQLRQIGGTTSSEKILLDILQEHGVYWAEPWNRLAAVYVQQNRLQEAYQLYQCVLYLKPWHFLALDGIVEIFLEQGNMEEARKWAAKRMPRLPPSRGAAAATNETTLMNDQRKEWIDQMLLRAQDALSDQEYRTRNDFLGSPEHYYRNQSSSNITNSSASNIRDSILKQQRSTEEDFDAWQ